MKVGLGTAQLGLDYGVANRTGRVGDAELGRILAVARERGVGVIDTAAAYGDAEERLGQALGSTHPFQIVTKLPARPDGAGPGSVAAWVGEIVRRSLTRLRAGHVHGILVHAVADLLGQTGPETWHKLEELREAGLVSRIGASVYDAAQLDALLAAYPLQLVQVPVSVLDQRLVRSGYLDRLHRAGIEVHARSAFLQGLLVMDPGNLRDPRFAEARETVRAFQAAARAAGRSPAEAATTFVVGLDAVDAAIFGVETAAQLEEILASAMPLADLSGAPKGLPAGWHAPFALNDPEVLDPSRWPR